MVPQVLVVDDDANWLRLISKELEGYAASFRVSTADSAQKALAVMRQEHIMLLITDLRMPGMDGFELLSRVLTDFPDVPVIIVTAYDRPKTKDVVFRSGAAGYLIKPFDTEKLAREINKMLTKKSEGGNLHNVSLETFLQLVEMEQQTCTLHVLDKTGTTGGVLYFRDGDILNARIGDRQGKAPAYEILSWTGVSVFIENNCVFEDKMIDGDLQAILLDAMRSKDENAEAEEAAASAAQQPESQTQAPVNTNDAGMKASLKTDAASAERQPRPAAEKQTPANNSNNSNRAAADAELSGVDGIRQRLTKSLGDYRGVEDVYVDDLWNPLLSEGSNIGEAFGLGPLNVMYANKADKGQYLVLPGDETTVIAITADASRDKIIGAVS
jgi:CheY-like chemotaxis protein